MSQTVEKPEASLDNFLHINVSTPEEVRRVEAYARNNPGTQILMGYESSMISRGALEEKQGFDQEYRRFIGGATVYPDENSFTLIKSDGCFQDFRSRMRKRVEDIVDDIYMGNKDIFDSEEKEASKIVGFGARVGQKDNSNLYGAFWREGEIKQGTARLMERDVVEIDEDEYRRLSYPIKEETGESLWKPLLEEAQNVEVQELLEEDLPENDVEAARDPLSCILDYRPKESKIETAVNWPAWQTS